MGYEYKYTQLQSLKADSQTATTSGAKKERKVRKFGDKWQRLADGQTVKVSTGPMIGVYCSVGFVLLLIVILILRKFCSKKNTEEIDE